MSSSRVDLSGKNIASKFKLEKRIGGGNFGDVYLGEQTVVGRPFALKVIAVSPSSYDASALEAKLLSLSTHPHVVVVRSAEYWRDHRGEDFCLIEMEYVEGGNLQSLIAKDIPIGDLIDVMKNVLFAVHHAHGLDIIHRDIKPANILIGGGGKLSDFGIAMISATGASASEYIYNGNLAPECITKPGDFTSASDIFAAGLTLLRGLNLIDDWRATRLAILNFREKMESGKFVPELGFHPRVPDALRKIVKTACHKDKSKRYASAAKFRDALEKLKIARNWRRIAPNIWECEYAKLNERIEIKPERKGFSVEYTRSASRQTSFCKTVLSEAEAFQYAYETMASTTLA